MYVCMQLSMFRSNFLYAFLYVCPSACMSVCLPVLMSVCSLMNMYLCMYVCMYVGTHVFNLCMVVHGYSHSHELRCTSTYTRREQTRCRKNTENIHSTYRTWQLQVLSSSSCGLRDTGVVRSTYPTAGSRMRWRKLCSLRRSPTSWRTTEVYIACRPWLHGHGSRRITTSQTGLISLMSN